MTATGLVDFFRSGGIIMWPLLAIGLAVLGLALRAGHELYVKSEATPRAERWTGGVLFWGLMALVLGLLGTFVGVSLTARAIMRAGDVPASVAWGGVGVALTTTIFGLLILGVAALAWFLLRWRLSKLGGTGMAAPVFGG